MNESDKIDGMYLMMMMRMLTVSNSYRDLLRLRGQTPDFPGDDDFVSSLGDLRGVVGGGRLALSCPLFFVTLQCHDKITLGIDNKVCRLLGTCNTQTIEIIISTISDNMHC